MSAPEKIKIFLVDDDIMFAESLKQTLKENRTDIKAFSSGEECLKCIDENPQIVILDYSFDDMMNGVQVLNRIKHASPETEVILLSGTNNYSIKDDSFKYGAYDFMEKNESSTFKLKNKVKLLCDEIESAQNSAKENNRLLLINAAIILACLLAFIITRLK